MLSLESKKYRLHIQYWYDDVCVCRERLDVCMCVSGTIR